MLALTSKGRLILQQGTRLCSTAGYQFLDVTTDSKKGYGILEMKKGRVNSLSLEMITELNNAIDNLEKDKNCRGVIITSKVPVFSAGLDILEMYQPKPDRLREFWISFQDLKYKLFSSSMVLIAAINGACPAGGCAIAFSCDYRILSDGKHKMGLNETLLGLAAPLWLCNSMKLLVGHRQAEKLLSLGIMCLPNEALKAGMVDEIVKSDELMNKSLAEMEKWLKIPDVGRVQTKALTRRKFLQEFQDGREDDLNFFLKSIQNPLLQEHLGHYLEALKKK